MRLKRILFSFLSFFISVISVLPHTATALQASDSPGTQPWHATIIMGTDSCNGALIDPYWVVTLATCLRSSESGNRPLESLEVVTGVTERVGDGYTPRERGQRRSVQQIIVHPAFIEPDKADLALIRLNKPMVPTEHVQPIPLTRDYLQIEGAERRVTSGWQARPQNRIQLRQISQQIANCPQANYPHGDYFCVKPTTGNLPIAECHDDFGAPLAVFDGSDWRLGGIQGLDGCNQPAGYLRIYKYAGWIDHQIQRSGGNFLVSDGAFAISKATSNCLAREIPHVGLRSINCALLFASRPLLLSLSFLRVEGNRYRITESANGLCLTDRSSGLAFSYCQQDENEIQLWTLKRAEGSTVQIIAADNKCLVDNGDRYISKGNCQTIATNARARSMQQKRQLWNLADAGKTFALQPSHAGPNACLDRLGNPGEIQNAALVQRSCDKDALSQYWKLIDAGVGAEVKYQVVASATGKCLTMSTAGNQVEQRACTGIDNNRQLWKLTALRDNLFQIRAQSGNNLCLDVRGGSTANNTPVQVYRCWDGTNPSVGANQKWRLKTVSSRNAAAWKPLPSFN